MPAAITAPITTPLVRASKERLISSMPNTMPASGVLNAADTPAAAPARISPGCRRGEMRPAANMMLAPTCTVGPSRPMEAPHSSPASSSTTLPIATRNDTSAARAAPSGSCRAAIACGMPLPPELGKNRRETKLASTNPAGVTASASIGRPAVIARKPAPARSAASASATAAAPTTMPPETNTTRRCQVRRATRRRRIWRRVRRVLGSFIGGGCKRRKEERPSFLKKRSKKLLSLRHGNARGCRRYPAGACSRVRCRFFVRLAPFLRPGLQFHTAPAGFPVKPGRMPPP